MIKQPLSTHCSGMPPAEESSAIVVEKGLRRAQIGVLGRYPVPVQLLVLDLRNV